MATKKEIMQKMGRFLFWSALVGAIGFNAWQARTTDKKVDEVIAQVVSVQGRVDNVGPGVIDSLSPQIKRVGDLTSDAKDLVDGLYDTDQDGVLNYQDECPIEVPKGQDINSNGCTDVDTDADGILDEDDACESEAEDMDGILDEDGCPGDDEDEDEIKDVDDKCPGVSWKGEGAADANHDGCTDADTDGDGVDDQVDKCPEVAPEGEDKNADGCTDPAIPDTDGDGFLDNEDWCKKTPHGFADRSAAEAAMAANPALKPGCSISTVRKGR